MYDNAAETSNKEATVDAVANTAPTTRAEAHATSFGTRPSSRTIHWRKKLQHSFTV